MNTSNETVLKNLVIETYEDKPIGFKADDAYVNITWMCQAFGKKAVEFLRLPSTKALLAVLDREEKVGKSHLLTVKGRNGGTWAHPDLALECARWISPEFAIWCNRTIRLLLAGQGPKPVGWSLETVLSPTNARRVSEIQDMLFDALKKLLDGKMSVGQSQAVVAVCSQWLRAWQLALETWKHETGKALTLPAAPRSPLA